MKKLNRKGFTIVELVIVVAVIAVLASALIPTFVGLVKRANLSADQQAARQLTSSLAVLAAEENATAEDVWTALEEEGYELKNLAPITANHAFYWYPEYKTVVLVNTEKGELVFPTSNEAMNDSFATDYANGVLFDLATAYQSVPGSIANVEDFATALTDGVKEIKLVADLAVTNAIVIPNGAEINLDLNGYNFDASAIDTRPFYVNDGYTANITINAEGAEIDCATYGLVDFRANTKGSVTINGGTYTANLDYGAFIKVRTGAEVDVVLNNVTYTDTATDSYIVNSLGGTANITVNGGTYDAALGFQATELTMTGATVTTDAYAVLVTESATIENCTITSASKIENELTGSGSAPAGAVQVQSGATATINNSTITVTGANATNVSAPLVFCSSGGKFVVNSTVLNTNATETYHVHKGGYPATFEVVVDGVTVFSDSCTA